MKYLTLLLFSLFVLFGCQPKVDKITIKLDLKKGTDLTYAVKKLEKTLKYQEIEFAIIEEKDKADLVIQELEGDEEADGFQFKKSGQQNMLTATNQRGLIYGIQDIMEQLENGQQWKSLTEKTIKAHYPFRAIKFNLPWFSYRSGENLSLHYETCRDLKFWESFLDMMVENKFNALTLWNLHPFIYMVQPKSFPEASPFTKEEFAVWQQFWRQLFKMAKQRGIDTFMVNWNIFVSEPLAKKYNIGTYSKASGFWGDGETNDIVEKYTREIVTQTINEYEDLTGIGITLGERMGGMTSEERAAWIDRTLIAGFKAADREARLIYRAPLSAGTTSHGTTSLTTEKITREALDTMGLDNEILVEFKFNWSHAHSSPKVSIVHGGILTDTYWNPEPTNYKGVWTMRNEDFHMLRWAQPDFIRAFMKNNSQSYINGCLIGSETYIPAKDYLTQEQYRTWEYAYERQWLFYKVWGNLMYNSDLADAFFENALAQKFTITEGKALLKAWKMASMNANRLASFHRGEWDATLYTEGFTTIKGRFIDINKFIKHPVLDSSCVNIQSYVAKTFEANHITPDKLADLTETESHAALQIANSLLNKYPNNQHLAIELNDIIAWAHHGFYFSEKIRGGIGLQNYRVNGDKTQQQIAIQHLEKAISHWQNLVKSVEQYNVPVFPYQFDAAFSWRKHIVDVENDLAIAKDDSLVPGEN